MKILKCLINVLIILIMACVIAMVFHRSNQLEDKLLIINSGLWENHPEIMQKEITEGYLFKSCLKDDYYCPNR